MASSAIGKVAFRFPALSRVAKECANPSRDLNTLRSEIWKMRLEFWYRKVTTYSQVVDAAKVEARTVFTKFKNPGDMSYRDVATGAVCGAQVFGAFCVGEVIGRNNIIGYNVGTDHYNQPGHH